MRAECNELSAMSQKGSGKTKKKADSGCWNRTSEEKVKNKRAGAIQKQLDLLAGGIKDKLWSPKRKTIETNEHKQKHKSVKKKIEWQSEKRQGGEKHSILVPQCHVEDASRAAPQRDESKAAGHVLEADHADDVRNRCPESSHDEVYDASEDSSKTLPFSSRHLLGNSWRESESARIMMRDALASQSLSAASHGSRWMSET